MKVTAPRCVTGHDFNHFCNQYIDPKYKICTDTTSKQRPSDSTHFFTLLDEKTYKELAATKDNLTTIQNRSAQFFVPIFEMTMYPEGHWPMVTV